MTDRAINDRQESDQSGSDRSAVNRRNLLVAAGVAVAAGATAAGTAAAAATAAGAIGSGATLPAPVAGVPVRSANSVQQKPNVVFILADNVGYGDLGSYGGGALRGAPTPRLDEMAREGLRLTQFLVEPACTPSRAALMTGRYPMRYGLQTLVIFPSHAYGLATDERTLPQALKAAGYHTMMDGKWHLGHADKKYWPQNRGFDYFYGNVTGEIDYL